MDRAVTIRGVSLAILAVVVLFKVEVAIASAIIISTVLGLVA